MKSVTDLADVAGIYRVSDTLHLGFVTEDGPYVVPVSCGTEIVDDQIVLYVFSIPGGKLHGFLSDEGTRVCAQCEIVYQYYEIPGEAIGVSYASAIGYGHPEKLADEDQAYAMDMILTHYGYEGYPYNKELLGKLDMFKIVLDDVTGKMNINAPD